MVEEVMDCIGRWNGERRGSFDTKTHILIWKVILGQMVEKVLDCIGRWNGERRGSLDTEMHILTWKVILG